VTAPRPPRPALICRQLLDALEGSEGRRKKRKRNTTPDALGLGIKRDLLEQATIDDPAPDAFDEWLLEQTLTAGPLAGATRAMALEILDEWRMVPRLGRLPGWLAEGAPSDDAAPEKAGRWRVPGVKGRPLAPRGGAAIGRAVITQALSGLRRTRRREEGRCARDRGDPVRALGPLGIRPGLACRRP
jgi:hypothetical protein